MSDTHLFSSSFSFCKYLPKQNKPVFPQISGCFQRITENITVERTVYDPLPSDFSLNMILQDFPMSWENQNVLEQTATCPLAFVWVTACALMTRRRGAFKVNSVNNIYLTSISGRSLRDRFSVLPLNNGKRIFWTRGSTWLLSKFQMCFLGSWEKIM